MKLNKTFILQCAVTICTIVPLVAGGAGMMFGTTLSDMQNIDISLDNHTRYLSGLLFAIGLGFLSTIPDIATKTERFRLLTMLVFIGGLARLIGILIMGMPSNGMVFGLVMELIVTPLLCLYQSQIAIPRSNHE